MIILVIGDIVGEENLEKGYTKRGNVVTMGNHTYLI